jgi:(R)-2-hydroxyacyl-CoA dehydratese activating ATPase
MAYFLGIDIGSSTSKGILLKDRMIAADIIIPSGINYTSTASTLKSELLKRAGITQEAVQYTVATGQGSSCVRFSDQTINDLRCCARGVQSLLPEARTVIDIEGQTTQVFHLGNRGQLGSFVISEKCASGSGCFLEMIANVLQIPLEEFGRLSLKSRDPVTFSNACAVFGESEAVSRVAEGIPKEDILAGVLNALAEKITVMVEKIGLEDRCAVCGSGALNTGLISFLEEKLKTILLVPPNPPIVTALGAALMAEESFQNKNIT